jgi:hypothetical protein
MTPMGNVPVLPALGDTVLAWGWPVVGAPSDPTAWTVALLAAGMLLGLLSVAGLVHRSRRHHSGIFRRLAQALGLGRRQQRLLVVMARRSRIGSPAALLVSRGCFDYAARCGRRAPRPEVAALRRQLFDAGAGPGQPRDNQAA